MCAATDRSRTLVAAIVRGALTLLSLHPSLEYANTMDRRLDRRVGGLAESADRRIPHRCADLVEERHLLRYAAEGLSAVDSDERFLLSYGADATRNALPARLVTEEAGDAKQDLREVDRVVERDDHARPERGLRRPHALECQRDVELVRSDEHACRASEQYRLERTTVRDAARQIEKVAKRLAEWNLVDARFLYMAAQTEQPRAGRLFRS